MSVGHREGNQQSMWIAHNEISRGSGQQFYEKLNELLREAKFDRRVAGRIIQHIPSIH